jgi:hypothetical protein
VAQTKYTNVSKCKNNKKKTEKRAELVPVAHTCNPSYSGGRDQEDRGSKPWTNSS